MASPHGGRVHPSFPRGPFSNSGKSIEKSFLGGGGLGILSHADNDKEMKHCVTLHGDVEEISWQRERCLNPPSF